LHTTLPEREDPTRKRQQQIALALNADYSALPEAERRAIELAHKLRTAAFAWHLWEPPEASNAPTRPSRPNSTTSGTASPPTAPKPETESPGSNVRRV